MCGGIWTSCLTSTTAGYSLNHDVATHSFFHFAVMPFFPALISTHCQLTRISSPTSEIVISCVWRHLHILSKIKHKLQFNPPYSRSFLPLFFDAISSFAHWWDHSIHYSLTRISSPRSNPMCGGMHLHYVSETQHKLLIPSSPLLWCQCFFLWL